MADNLELDLGSGGGTVATDEVGGLHYQRMKVTFGGDGTATDVTEAVALPVVASGTVTATPTGTQNVFVSNSGTIVPSGTQNVFVSNNGTVTANGGTILGAGGTVNIVPSGTQNVFVSNSATVTANGGTLLGQAGTVTANIGTSGTLLGQAGTVTALQGTNPWAISGSATLSGTALVHVTNNGTVTGGSAVIGQGWTVGTDWGSAPINLTATGTVVSAVTSKRIYVYSEAFTVQGGTVTITVRQGAGGGTIVGPRQFSPTGGIARANAAQWPLYYAAAGSPVVFELSGSGTVGGDIAWVANA